MTAQNKYCKNKDWLYDQYVNKRKSMPKIAEELGIQAETVRAWIHKHEIPIRSGSESHSGDLHPLFGKHHTPEGKKNISISLSGENNPNYGKKRPEQSERMKGSGNPRYGAIISNDQRHQQTKSMIKFYEEHPEAIINLSEKRKQYYIDNPDAARKHAEKIKQYYKEHPEVLQQAAEKRVQYYSEHPLSEEEKEQRASHLYDYFNSHPEARKEHSKLMKVNNPSMRPEVAAKISDSMVEWHKNNANPVGTGSMPGRFFTCKDGNKIWLRSSYEFRVASILEELGISWKCEPYAFPLDSLHTSYRPDIYLPDSNIWIEVKGYLSWSSKQKLIEFNKIYPNEKLLLVYLRQIEEIEEKVVRKEVINIQDYCITLEDQIESWKLEDIELEKLKTTLHIL